VAIKRRCPPPQGGEGRPRGRFGSCLDYLDCVLHVFHAEARTVFLPGSEAALGPGCPSRQGFVLPGSLLGALVTRPPRGRSSAGISQPAGSAVRSGFRSPSCSQLRSRPRRPNGQSRRARGTTPLSLLCKVAQVMRCVHDRDTTPMPRTSCPFAQCRSAFWPRVRVQMPLFQFDNVDRELMNELRPERTRSTLIAGDAGFCFDGPGSSASLLISSTDYSRRSAVPTIRPDVPEATMFSAWK